MTSDRRPVGTRHLTPDELVNLLDGRASDEAAGHLAACDACRGRLAELRDAWNAAAAVDVPEPSPLFWDHLSARVRAAVDAEGPPRRFRWTFGRVWRPAALTFAAAAVALAIAVNVGDPRRDDPQPASSTAQATMPSGLQPSTMPDPAASGGASASPASFEDDEPLALMVDLASEVDWDNAEDVTLSARGGVDRLIVDMSDEERAELQRMLKEAFDSGA